MLPTQNIIDDCDFINASDITTIVNLMMALVETKDCVDVDAVENFKYRNVLSISSHWSKEIS